MLNRADAPTDQHLPSSHGAFYKMGDMLDWNAASPISLLCRTLNERKRLMFSWILEGESASENAVRVGLLAVALLPLVGLALVLFR
jgi:hypothetical protein